MGYGDPDIDQKLIGLINDVLKLKRDGNKDYFSHLI